MNGNTAAKYERSGNTCCLLSEKHTRVASMSTPSDGVPDSRWPVIERLAFTPDEIREVIPGLSDTTLWRLEKRGLIKRVPGIRNRLYSVESVRAFASGKVKQTQ